MEIPRILLKRRRTYWVFLITLNLISTSDTWASNVDSTQLDVLEEKIEVNVEKEYSTVTLSSNCSATSLIILWKDGVKLQAFTIPPDQVVTKRLYQGWYWIEIYSISKPEESRNQSKSRGTWEKSKVIFKPNAISLGLSDDVKIIINCPLQAYLIHDKDKTPSYSSFLRTLVYSSTIA